MRATELLESDGQYEPVSLDYLPASSLVASVVKFMRMRCQPWLNATDINNPVFRGTKTKDDVFLRKVRPDRIPRDTEPRIHDLYNKLIAMVGGHANRTNSAFVSSYRATAGIYGNIRVAIPIGEFNYTWSPVWNDWYTGLSGSKQMLTALMYPAEGKLLSKLLHDRMFGLSRKGDDFSEIDRLLYDLNNYDPAKVNEVLYADKELKKAISSGNEIMVECDAILYIAPELYTTYIVPNYIGKQT